ncbi:MAG TPA: ATP-binding protein [Caldilinea sp.]|nr:ATP-binding protein [Caldilinea sp.]
MPSIGGLGIKGCMMDNGLTSTRPQQDSSALAEGSAYHLLLVEDNPADADLIEEYLSGSSDLGGPMPRLSLSHVPRLADAFVQMWQHGPFDLVLLDLSLPDSVGIDTVTRFRREAPDTAIVVLTGLNDASTAMNALRVGAQDYLVKGMLNSYVLERTIRHAIERNRLRAALQASEAQMRQIVEHNADGMVVVDLSGVILSANPAACTMFNLTADELAGRTLAVPSTAGGLARLDIERPQGDVLHAEVRVARLDATRNIASLRDVSDRVHAEEQLAHYVRILAALSKASERLLWMDSLEASFAIVLEELGTSIAASRVYVMERQAGVPEDETTRKYFEWAAPDYARHLDNFGLLDLAPILEAGTASEAELRDGQPVYGWTQDFPIPEQRILSALSVRSIAMIPIFIDQTWWGILGVDDCATERQWSELEIDALTTAASLIGASIHHAETKDAEKALLEMKDEFISSVSHELRTPIFALQGFLDLLAGGSVSDPVIQKEFLGLASKDAKRLADLVNDLLDVSRLDSGRLEMSLETVSLDKLVAETLSAFRSLTDEKQITISQIGAAYTGLHNTNVWGDRSRLRQVLENLISNAIKYSPSGASILVKVSTLDAAARLEVVDQGPGIPIKAQSHLFSKFYRVHSKQHRWTRGTGLGLYLAKRIIDEHGGVIGVNSEPDKGSTFYFTVPLASSEATIALKPDSLPV